MTRNEYYQNLGKYCIELEERVRTELPLLLDTLIRKNKDYVTSDHDPFDNFRSSAYTADIDGVERVIVSRLAEKLKRISNLLQKEPNVRDEPIADTALDIAGYALILRAFLKWCQEPTSDEEVQELMKGFEE